MTIAEPQFDTKAYGRLLMKAHPGVINSDAENERLLTIVEGLMAKGETRLSAEEDALLGVAPKTSFTTMNVSATPSQRARPMN